MQKHVLLIEDEGITAINLAQTIEEGGYRVTVAFDGQEGLDAYHNDPADLVITDLNMPVLDGFGVIGSLKEQSPDIKIAVLPAGRKRAHPQFGRRVHYGQTHQRPHISRSSRQRTGQLSRRRE
jgi:CheY-like chemotaxis protein